MNSEIKVHVCRISGEESERANAEVESSRSSLEPTSSVLVDYYSDFVKVHELSDTTLPLNHHTTSKGTIKVPITEFFLFSHLNLYITLTIGSRDMVCDVHSGTLASMHSLDLQ